MFLIMHTISERRCGIVIKYDADDLTKAIVTLLTNESLLEEYRSNAFEYSKQFDWNNIFDGAIAEVLTFNHSPQVLMKNKNL